MTEAVTPIFQSLRRPRLLIRAARFGLSDYDRTRTLRRLLGEFVAECALMPLMEKEAQCEIDRRAGDAGYSVARHVEVLAALMHEARLRADQAVAG